MTKNIVYYTDGAVFGGVEQIMISLLTHLDRTIWNPILIHHAEPGLAPLLEEARSLGVHTVSAPGMHGLGAIANLPRFLGILREQHATVFHAHLNWLLSCKFGLLAATIARIPARIATLHQYLLPPWKTNIVWQMRVVAAGVHRYIAVSQAVAQQLSQSFHVPSEKIKVIHNGIQPGAFERQGRKSEAAALNLGTKHPVVLTVARLDEQKGHKYLLEAMRQIPDAVFAFAGNGVERTMLECKALDLGIADRVAFLGYRTDIPALLADCDVFVLPSLYEGFPISVLEAMAAGKPVVATAVGGTPEAVADGVTGYLVPPRDPAALAHRIREVLSKPTVAAQMGMTGRMRVQQEFSLEKMTQLVYQTYDDCVTGLPPIPLKLARDEIQGRG